MNNSNTNNIPIKNSNANNNFKNLVASSAGSFLTSLIVTPLDVVKTRLQTQVTKPPPKSVLKTQFCRQHRLSYHSHFQKKHVFNNTTDAFKKIYKNEGIFTFWRGLAPSLLMTVPNAAIEGYTIYTVPLIAGSIARMVSASVTSPLELLRTNSQGVSLAATKNAMASVANTAQHAVSNAASSTCKVLGCSANVCLPTAAAYSTCSTRIPTTPQKFNSFTLFNDIIKNVGVKGLWRGYIPTIVRDVPFSSLYWGGYEVLKLKFMRFQDPSYKVGGNSPFIINFASGAISGAFAAALTTPIDVIKTRIQMSVQQSSNHSNVNTKELRSVRYHFKQIIKEEGFIGLTKGLVPRVAKVGPACAIMISTFEWIKQSNFD
ncbi:hypothetical protein DICPUDRAFT_158807 [Dictyostelium purpureum]|uniref:Mitochondrial substrate carrier family protein n=1 Tax=Dictyostelium purpureum TaxID=5786 RepID=F1A2J4_DICPU|nr:uncharacterized protein DICPUDRAFT_158807 [Dictyostelium purpureum]EGC29587.1 hypothetical protein DICPUDRAFT_158807 [Dictyostelium purpureum]|eukprot:XP_003293889.1 hypothetical protein DICPUDRAFT_158807 [Dictyostelium purpureum]